LREFFIGIRTPAPAAPAASRSEDPPRPNGRPPAAAPPVAGGPCARQGPTPRRRWRRSGYSSLVRGPGPTRMVGLSGKTRDIPRPSSCSRAPVGYIRRLRPPFETFPRASFGLGLGRVVPC
jgi:hypothetical protein